MRLRVRGVGKTEQHRIARQVRIFDRVCTSSVTHPIDEAMRSPTGWGRTVPIPAVHQ
jgi:hypothetical protein